MELLHQEFIVDAAIFSLLAMDDCATEGEIRVTGITGPDIIAGRVDLCYELHWRAVCHSMWNRNDAKVVCRAFGFQADGKTILTNLTINNHLHSFCSNLGAQACQMSCFGKNDDLKGIANFQCAGNESSLIDCSMNINERCGEYGGVICCKSCKPS